jgi:hypothetical protein
MQTLDVGVDPTKVGFFDIDTDGLVDLFVSRATDLVIWKNATSVGSTSLHFPQRYALDFTLLFDIPRDVDGNGVLDLIGATEIVLATAWSPPMLMRVALPATPADRHFVDINRDTHLDVVALEGQAVSIYLAVP